MGKKVQWTSENDRKLLLQLVNPSTKDIPIEFLASLFHGATPKAILERIAKLRREKKSAILTHPPTTVSAPSGTTTFPPCTPKAANESPQPKPKGVAEQHNEEAEEIAALRKVWKMKSNQTGDYLEIGPAPKGKVVRKRKRDRRAASGSGSGESSEESVPGGGGGKRVKIEVEHKVEVEGDLGEKKDDGAAIRDEDEAGVGEKEEGAAIEDENEDWKEDEESESGGSEE